MVRLVVREKSADGEPSTIRDVKTQKVYLGEIPLMTIKEPLLLMVPSGSSSANCIVRLESSSLRKRDAAQRAQATVFGSYHSL